MDKSKAVKEVVDACAYLGEVAVAAGGPSGSWYLGCRLHVLRPTQLLFSICISVGVFNVSF